MLKIVLIGVIKPSQLGCFRQAKKPDPEVGRQKPDGFTADLTADGFTDFGDPYLSIFKFANALNAVKAAIFLVTSGTKQLHRLIIDNGRAYPSYIRYAARNFTNVAPGVALKAEKNLI